MIKVGAGQIPHSVTGAVPILRLDLDELHLDIRTDVDDLYGPRHILWRRDLAGEPLRSAVERVRGMRAETGLVAAD